MNNLTAFDELWTETPELKERFLRIAREQTRFTESLGGSISIVADTLTVANDTKFPFISIQFDTPRDDEVVYYRALCKSRVPIMKDDNKYQRLSQMAWAVTTAVYFCQKFKNTVLEGLIERYERKSRDGSHIPETILREMKKSLSSGKEALSEFPADVEDQLQFDMKVVKADNDDEDENNE